MFKTINSSTSFSLKIFTALIGSPTYFASAKPTVLTRPLSRTRRQGMILGRNMLELGEVLQQPRAITMALLRVKLNAEDAVRAHRAAERRAVLRLCQHVFVASAVKIIRM